MSLVNLHGLCFDLVKIFGYIHVFLWLNSGIFLILIVSRYVANHSWILLNAIGQKQGHYALVINLKTRHPCCQHSNFANGIWIQIHVMNLSLYYKDLVLPPKYLIYLIEYCSCSASCSARWTTNTTTPSTGPFSGRAPTSRRPAPRLCRPPPPPPSRPSPAHSRRPSLVSPLYSSLR